MYFGTSYRALPISPWTTFRRLHEEMDRFVDNLQSEVSAGCPALNVWYNEEAAIIKAELPGVDSENLEVSASGNHLSLKGARNQPELPEGHRLLRNESEYGTFGRTLRLPFEVDADKIEAQLKNGILSIKLPRKAEEKARKVEISAH